MSAVWKSAVWKSAAVVVAVLLVVVPRTTFTLEVADWAMGDLFLGIGDLSVRETKGKYAVLEATAVPSGEYLVDGNRGYTGGCAIDPVTGYLWTTSLTGNTISVFGDHTLLDTINVRTYTSPKGPSRGSVGSLVFDAAGNVFAGSTDGLNRLVKLNAAGTVVDTFQMPRGVKWFDLASDQRTIFYTSDDTVIHRYDLAMRSPLADFASMRDGSIHALRLLSNGQGLLVAGSISVSWLDLNGAVMQEYWLSGVTGFRGLNITPDGKSFWTYTDSTELYRFDIATTQLLAGPIATNFATVNGLCARLEYTAAEDRCRVTGGDGQPMSVTCARLEACRNPADDDLDGLTDADDPNCLTPAP